MPLPARVAPQLDASKGARSTPREAGATGRAPLTVVKDGLLVDSSRQLLSVPRRAPSLTWSSAESTPEVSVGDAPEVSVGDAQRGSLSAPHGADNGADSSPASPPAKGRRSSVVLLIKDGAGRRRDDFRQSYADVRHICGLLAGCRWSELAAVTSRRWKKFARSYFATAQSEHTVVGVLYPRNDPVALYDTQCVQIFWVVVHLELAMLAMLYSNISSPTISIVAMLIEAMVTIVPCIAAAVLTRLFFRWGNRGYRMHRWGLREKRERAVAEVRVGMSKEEKMQVASSLREAERRERGARWSWKERRGIARFAVAWAIVLFVQLVCTLVILIQAYLFGEEKMRSFLLSFVVSLTSDFFIVEPLEVLGLVMLPFIFNAQCCVSLRKAARDLGFA